LVDRFTPDAPKDGTRADLYPPDAGIDGNSATPDTSDGRSITGSEVGNEDLYGISLPPDGPMRIDGSNVDGADGARAEGVTDGPMFNE
jgi:hypothetical protein